MSYVSRFADVFFFPKRHGYITLGVLTAIEKAPVPDRGAGQVPERIRRYFRGFVLACSFCV